MSQTDVFMHLCFAIMHKSPYIVPRGAVGHNIGELSSPHRRRKANLATSQVNFACLLYSLRLLFRANTKLKREAAELIPALRAKRKLTFASRN